MNTQRIFIIIGGVVVSVFTCFVLWFGFSISALDAGENGKRTFAISTGQSVEDIAAKLKEQNLIANSFAFQVYVTVHGDRGKLQAGTYELSPSLSVKAIVAKFVKGDVITKRLIIPEGSTIAQIKELAVKQGIDSAAFDQALLAPHTNSFLGAKPDAVDLEGYLFPDSYTIDPGMTADSLVQLMLDTFGKKVTADYAAAFAARGMTLHEGLTLASIIEKEVSIEADRAIVSQVFHSRLKIGQGLESDATNEYAAKRLGVPFSNSINSVYNTYRHKGLPPGPICSPGLSAIKAATSPASTNYYYFLSGKDGKTYFARTFAEHQANIVKYLN